MAGGGSAPGVTSAVVSGAGPTVSTLARAAVATAPASGGLGKWLPLLVLGALAVLVLFRKRQRQRQAQSQDSRQSISGLDSGSGADSRAAVVVQLVFPSGSDLGALSPEQRAAFLDQRIIARAVRFSDDERDSDSALRERSPGLPVESGHRSGELGTGSLLDDAYRVFAGHRRSVAPSRSEADGRGVN